jgi:serine/threonine protein kinase
MSVPTTITGESLPSWKYENDAELVVIPTNDDNNNETTIATASSRNIHSDNTSQKVKKRFTILQQQHLISNHYYYYDHPIDLRIVQLLLTSRVSRTIDAIHQRHPLHYCAIYIAHQTYLVHNHDSHDDDSEDHSQRIHDLLVLLQLVIDSYTKQCSSQDKYGCTPIVLLFDTVQKLQYRIYMEQCHYCDNTITNIDTTIAHHHNRRRRELSQGYTPALQFIQLLIQAPITTPTTHRRSISTSHEEALPPTEENSITAIATTTSSATMDHVSRIVAMEDRDGRIPLHIALQVVTSSDIIRLLVVAYPAGLVHTTTKEGWCPLHAALCCPYTAHLQSIEVMRILLFHSYQTGRYGTTVDGRLAMKMEDTRGYYPIHYACQNHVTSTIISLLVERYTKCCTQLTSSSDDLPVHCLIQNLHPVLLQHILSDVIRISNSTTSSSSSSSDAMEPVPDCNTNDRSNDDNLQELIIELRIKLNVLLRPLILSPDAKQKISIADSLAGMLPLHIAILFQALDYTMLLKMLQSYPYAAMQYTNNLQCLQSNVKDTLAESLLVRASNRVAPNINAYSAMDLHDLCHQGLNKNVLNVYNDVEWYRIRELLFSFGPTLESHRHRQDLLDHGVQIIIDELLFHEQELDSNNVDNDKEENTSNDNPPSRRLMPGYHHTVSNTARSVLPDLEITHSVSAMEEALGLRPRNRRRRRRRGNKVSKRLPSNQSRHHPTSSSNLSSGRHVNRTNTLPNGPTSGSDTLTSVDNGSKVVQLDMLQLQTNSSIYDEDDVRFIHDDDNDDGDDDGSFFSGDENCSGSDESYVSDEDDNFGTEDDDTLDDSGTRGSLSLETTSRSRLRTTFEEDEDEDGTENDSTRDMVSEDFTSRRDTTYDDDDDDGETGTTRSFEDESVSTIRSHSRLVSKSTFTTTSKSRRRGQFFTNAVSGGSDSRRVTFDDDESTRVSNSHKSFDLDHIVNTVGTFFDRPRENHTLTEEKKDEGNDPTSELPSTPRAANIRKKTLAYQRPPYMSEVGMRIWTFFVMYCDLNNPKDNYADKLAAIFAAIKFSTWEELVSSPLPPYAKNYIKSGTDIDGLSFRDIASPKCRALIHKTSYFLGKYDFGSDHDILVYRTTRDETVIVEASEWLYTTEASTNAKNPGISEEKIWSTGEVPAEIGVTFETHQRPVWIKFTKKASEYDNEVDCRVRLGVSVDDENAKGTSTDVIPILQHFNAISTERKDDQNYIIQRSDERFQSLNLINGSSKERNVQILLHEYPYVIVYPAPLRGTLYDYFLKHGTSQVSECKQILGQVLHALGFLHNNGICHGNICMRNIVSLDSNARDALYWGFLNLSCASFTNKASNQFLGGIDAHGFAQFETETLPPEMFMEVSANELKQYLAYWATVEKRFNVTIDKSIINPRFDIESGSTYIVKCHFVPLTSTDNNIPLPYDIVPASNSTDFWALGQLLFVLHTGRNLFHVSARDGRLYDYKGICNWDGRSLIYEYVEDELFQDVLLRCLSTIEARVRLTVTDLLHHPFFTGECLTKKVREARQLESAVHKRDLMKKLHDNSQLKWLKEHSVSIHCWHFDILKRFHYSPTEIVRKMMHRKSDVLVPCSSLLLPYDPFDISLSSHNHDTAEQFGIELLELDMICHFCVALKRAITLADSGNKNGWSLAELEEKIDFPLASFSKIQSSMSELASRHVEEFRRNPLAVAIKLITQQIENVYGCFEGRDMYFYLIDEYSLVPVPISTTRVHVADNRQRDLFLSVLPLTHLCLLYAMGVKDGLSGLLSLLCPNISSCDIPSSWKVSEAAINRSLSIDSLRDVVEILLESQTQSHSTQLCISDNLSVIHDYLVEMDLHRDVGGLQRVVVANTCLWTNQDGVSSLEDLARSYTLSDALRNAQLLS